MASSKIYPDNQKVVLREYPSGLPTQDHFSLETEPTVAPGDGEVLVKVHSLAIDAWIGTTLSPGWAHEMMPLGATVGALGVGHVVAGNSERFAVGDAVAGPLSAQTYARIPAANCWRVDDKSVPVTAHLGLLSITTGVTAYFGIRDVAQVTEGDTVLVSAAAGAVGSVAGQMAKLEGADRVIGIAGGPAKTDFLTREMGFDAAIDYKGESVDERLTELAPDGIDVYFDNVGGAMLDEVLNHIRDRARVVICGAISQYDDCDDVYGPKRYLRLAERYARMEGFTAFHFEDRYPEAYRQIGEWMAQDRLRIHEQVEHGIASFPRALQMLFTGGNTGKLLVAL